MCIKYTTYKICYVYTSENNILQSHIAVLFNFRFNLPFTGAMNELDAISMNSLFEWITKSVLFFSFSCPWCKITGHLWAWKSSSVKKRAPFRPAEYNNILWCLNEQLPLLQGHIYAELSQSYVINISTCSHHLQVRFLCGSHPASEPGLGWTLTEESTHIDTTQSSTGTAGPSGESVGLNPSMRNIQRTASLRFNEHLHKFWSYPSCWQITFNKSCFPVP